MKAILSLFILSFSSLSLADCMIRSSAVTASPQQADILYRILDAQDRCPQNVLEFRKLLKDQGYILSATMVANRGFHDGNTGSYSFFERVVRPNGRSLMKQAELFFGHFTQRSGDSLTLSQTPARGRLMIELIAWDPMKKYYNFYELIGNGSGGTWFYRGDSADIWRDNLSLKLQQDPMNPVFGQRLRCSGCHNSGGPIMKELDAPHNDWWRTRRPLNLTAFDVSQQVADVMRDLDDASTLAAAVKVGIRALERSPTMARLNYAQDLRVALKPLFCTTEVNLRSDLTPNEITGSAVIVSSDSFVSPLLSRRVPLRVDRGLYHQVLSEFGAQFPGTPRTDADHAWLVPVKGESNIGHVRQLVARRIITAEFAADVLAVDYKNPTFSKKRCRLLKLVPSNNVNWVARFTESLKASKWEGAKELLDNITNPSRTRAMHLKTAGEYLSSVQRSLRTETGARSAIRLLHQRRREVYRDEISRNPRGQIFEPGFRVIFPELRP